MNDSSQPDLPEVRSAVLSESEVQDLFNDIRACADVLLVRLKTGDRRVADDESVPLDDARTMLTSGGARGVQIRYVYEGREYSDTLLRADGGYRLIRL